MGLDLLKDQCLVKTFSCTIPETQFNTGYKFTFSTEKHIYREGIELSYHFKFENPDKPMIYVGSNSFQDLIENLATTCIKLNLGDKYYNLILDQIYLYCRRNI